MKSFCVLSALIGCINASIIDISSENKAVFNNGYVKAVVNLSAGAAWVSELYGDYQGKAAYGSNLLASNGLRLEREDAEGNVVSAAGSGSNIVKYSVTQNDDNCGIIQITEVADDLDSPSVLETWTFSLCTGDRHISFASSGSILNDSTVSKVRSIRHSLYTTPLSTTAFFDSGVVQIMGARDSASHFGSTDKLSRVYFLGGSGSVDVQRTSASGGETDQVVLLNAESGSFVSGFQDVLVGTFTRRDIWGPGSTEDDVTVIDSSISWSRSWSIYPNNKNFPTSTLPSSSVSNLDNDVDLEAFMIGIYANAVPCLCTYVGEVVPMVQVAQIATSLRYDMGRGYDGTYNYFDPDNFFTLSAILYSGDVYLQQQVRQVIERTGTFMKTDNGQLPHHFNSVMPYYLALSGETQTGPNTFWTMTALRYAATTGDTEWLSQYMPTLRTASSFVFDLINADTNLVFAPGSLMIDVFIRNNYTSDSNAMVVGFLRDFASAERLVGNATRADELEATADKVSAAVNTYLWATDAESGQDHYITQLNSDGTTRDFIDYDSNLIAVANGVSDETRSRAIQKRVDGGQCSAASGGGAQFVSERYYGTEDTTGGNVGDSWCAMARIGWFDARGRKRFGSAEDLTYFEERILNPVRSDLIANTWMHERYGCDGNQQENRTMYYFEYPSYVTMLLREIRYGVELTLESVSIEPFSSSRADGFEYHFGNVDVSHSQTHTSISVPGSGLFNYQVKSLLSNSEYSVTLSAESCASDVSWSPLKATSTAEGVLSFTAPKVTSPCAVLVDVSSGTK